MKFHSLTILFLIVVSGGSVHAQEEVSGIRAGPKMAVVEANHKDGFRLAENAKKVIGLGVKPPGSSPYKIPKGAVVYYGDRIGVYRLRDGWFKLVEIQKISDSNSETTISSSDLKTSDQIAVEGVALLRVSDMDAFGGEQ